METFTKNEVLRLARLARLELSANEVELFTRQLGDILEFAQQVNAVDTSAIAEPAGDAIPPQQDTLREDVLLPSLSRAEVLELAPDADRERGLFKVPRVFNR